MMITGAYCALTRNPLLLSRSFNIFPKPTPLQFPTTPSPSFPSFNRFPSLFPQLCIRHSRLSTLPHNDSGGFGGDSGSGGWDPGDNDSDDGGGKWSFLSCIAKKTEPMNTLVLSAFLVFGFSCIVVGGQALVEVPFLLFGLTMVCLSLNEFFDAVFSFWIYLIVFGALFCIVQIIALAYALTQPLRIREGASEDDIKSLPMYRFCQPNVMIMVDKNKTQLEARTGSHNRSHISELSLHPDDSECCICLCPYVDGTELYRLPCTHHFHCECIGRWLRTKATCPLCKFNIRIGDIMV
ncbi:C3HC4-type RING zinc finger protein [Medicago truncatula]|uniref:RING-type E3 ubiquitin transferase n=1 Tax=Medicago truncatula TaxID=3880 RepID=G7L4T0_MEDTR|nr:C3HC4-type RING zinc finger protein [Medicago truncatula]